MTKTNDSKSLENLLNCLSRLSELNDDHWKPGLSERKIRELEFHDRDRDKKFVAEAKTTDTFEKFYGNKKYYSATKRSQRFTENWLRDQCNGGGVFLDYACGDGLNATKASELGATLSIGIDISSVSIDNARERAKKLGAKDVIFCQSDAENTGLPNDSIDFIICAGVLHHLDLSYAFPEIRRILKPGGKVLAIEALDYNPAIKLYRFLTPDMRTDWEKAHILSLRDVKFASRFFTVSRIDFWHVIGYAAGKIPFLAPVLEFLDKGLEKVPFLNRMAWIFTFELQKPYE